MTATTSNKLDLCERILKLLGDVDRPGNVCTGGDRPLAMPGLEVDGLGLVKFPLGKTQARKLIKLCQQAPYGKGTDTVVDTDVRRVWELDPTQFQLTNPKWDDLVASIIADVKRELGLEDRKLSAHLYKLLLYEEGSFFLPHRDGEKLDRMVATLVIGLPSVHEGGELIVSHNGKQHSFLFTGAASGYELSFAAFYADCQHEVRPVRSGYRLCLTYNVTLAKSRGKKGIAAPSYSTTAAAITELLGDWRQHADYQKIAITLDHRYSQDGLTVDKLKGIDRARTEVLFEAAEEADCVAHLALVTLWQSGSAEGGYDDYSYGRGRGYHWSDDEDEDEDEDDSDETVNEYVMGEVFEECLSANHWSDRQGKKVGFGEIHLDKDEIVADTPLDEWDPNKEDFEGYTGNAGMTLERWYHRAAIVVWPREIHFAVLCDAGTDAAIGGLQPMVKRLNKASRARRDEQRRECLAFATAIINTWQPHHGTRYGQKADEINRNNFLALLCELDDPALVRRFLSQVMTRDGEIQLDKAFAKFCKRHGWEKFEPELTAVIGSATVATIARNAELLETLCLQRDKTADRLELCRRLSEQAVNAVEAFDERPAENDWRVGPMDRAALLGSLVKAMLAVDAVQPLSRLIDHALACVGNYDLTDSHLAAIFSSESRLVKLPAPNAAISHWLDACRRELENRTSQPPREPTDYRRAHDLSCNCSDCRELSKFLASPDQRQYRFAVAKHRRRHLHQTIDGNRCDLTHVTERRGRPYTLVCTKTKSSYDAACKIHQRDLQNLSRITAIVKKIG